MDKGLYLILGDITTEKVDAIVNAANTALSGGGGVDGAIHRAAGPGLLEECRTLKGCPVGSARLTAGHDLPAAHVIHTAGPVWKSGDDNEEELLRSSYKSCLKIAVDKQFDTVSFPCISTGVYRFPFEKAAAIALTECAKHQHVQRYPAVIRFVCFSEHDFVRYQRVASNSDIDLRVITGAAPE